MKSREFSDFDAFSSAVRDVECVMMLQNATRRRWSVSQVGLPGIHVQLGRLGSGNILEGAARPDGYLLYLPLTATCAYSANGTALEKNSFMILEPGCEFCLSTKFAHDWCSIFIPTQKLAPGGEFAEPSLGPEKMTCRVALSNRQIVSQFRATLGQIMTMAANCPNFESALAATSAAAEMLKVSSQVLGDGQAGELHHEGRPRLPRQEIVRRAKGLLEQREGEPLHVGEMASAAGVSERTLRQAFHDCFGVGPVRYLQLRQLHQIHHTLRAAEPDEVTVSEILLRYGEWEFSRFAARYRRLFGERPSQTLRRKTR